MMLMPLVEARARNVYFIREENTPLVDYFAKCRPLYGSAVRYDRDGFVSYATWREIPSEIRKDGLLPQEFIQISRLPPQAVIYAQYTRYQHFVELRINKVTADDGSIETAIRSVDHVLEGESGKETFQVIVAGQRASNLLDLFKGRSFSDVKTDEFEAAQRQTYAFLADQKFDPGTIVETRKRRLTKWLIKGSLGKDSLGRRNKLITLMALSAAHRVATERQKGLSKIQKKFIRMREALIFEREFARDIFTEMVGLLETMPNHMIFRYPTRKPEDKQVGIIVGMLESLTFQLNQPHTRPYRSVGREAGKILAEMVRLLREGKREEITNQQLIKRARTLLKDALAEHKYIYPPEKST